MGSQLTNVLRCLYLEACGYQVTVTELVGWEHSLKNELILARHTGQRRRSAAERLRAVLAEFGLKGLEPLRYPGWNPSFGQTHNWGQIPIVPMRPSAASPYGPTSSTHRPRLSAPYHPARQQPAGDLCRRMPTTRRLLALIEEYARKAGIAIHAYVLMSNHFHLLATPDTVAGIPQMMQDVGRRYVRYFNQRQGRTGTLWEGRYRSTLIQAERYLLACMAYIDLNPVRAGIALATRRLSVVEPRSLRGIAQ